MPAPNKSTPKKTTPKKAPPKKAASLKTTDSAKASATPKKVAAVRKTTAKTTKKRVDFTLHVRGAEQVYLAGSFNDWDAGSKALKRGKDEIWRTWTNLPAGTHEYRFVVDGNWVEDPAAEDRQPNPYGSYNSVVNV